MCLCQSIVCHAVLGHRSLPGDQQTQKVPRCMVGTGRILLDVLNNAVEPLLLQTKQCGHIGARLVVTGKASPDRDLLRTGNPPLCTHS